MRRRAHGGRPLASLSVIFRSQTNIDRFGGSLYEDMRSGHSAALHSLNIVDFARDGLLGGRIVAGPIRLRGWASVMAMVQASRTDPILNIGD